MLRRLIELEANRYWWKRRLLPPDHGRMFGRFGDVDIAV